jgi:tetratricopeptide (TPR) repeat protein
MRPYVLPVIAFVTWTAIFATEPKGLEEHLELARVQLRQARDGDDPALYRKAAATLEQALRIADGNFDALKLQVAVLLGLHDFAKALRQANELNRKMPDDIVVWGHLVDANMAIGEYAEAEKDAQWILDLRRGSTLGFTKAAALREVFGDREGAIEFYNEALLRTSPNDANERSWLITKIARIQLAQQNLKQAGEWINNAIALNPGNVLALRTLADLKSAQHDYAEAVRVRRQVIERARNTKDLYALALVLDKAGQTAEAESAFREFESKARAEQSQTVNANRELVFYYADRCRSPAEALAVASKAAETRHDVETLDAYAWALYRAGKFTDAEALINRALAPGASEANLACHALRIAEATKNQDAATRLAGELSGLRDSDCDPSAGAPR